MVDRSAGFCGRCARPRHHALVRSLGDPALRRNVGPMKRWLLPLEIAAWVAIGVADAYGLIPLSRTPFLFALGWLSLRLRGCRWRDVGFAAPPRWPRAITIGVLLGIGMEILSTFVTVP